MSIGPQILEQTSESLRKVRNTARFILGNIGELDGRTKPGLVPKDQLGLVSLGAFIMLGRNVYWIQVDRYVMHQLYELEQTALSGYAQYNFPKSNSCPLEELMID
jgi:isoleucyl-tRNA synthetase